MMAKGSRDYKKLSRIAFQMWQDGTRDIKDIAKLLDVGDRTVSRWKSNGKWVELENEEAELERKTLIVARRVRLKALEEYEQNPHDKEVQSLVLLLRDIEKKAQPAKELLNYIIKFLDQTTNYFIEKGLLDELAMIQEHVPDLAEYLKAKNQGV